MEVQYKQKMQSKYIKLPNRESVNGELFDTSRLLEKVLARDNMLEAMYKVIRNKCDYSEWAPADIVDEFADMDINCKEEYNNERENRTKGMPVMECPNCCADFYYTGEKKTKKGSYWIDEDEHMPF